MIEHFSHCASCVCQLRRTFKWKEVMRPSDMQQSSSSLSFRLLVPSRVRPPGATPSSADLLELCVKIFTATETINRGCIFPGGFALFFNSVCGGGSAGWKSPVLPHMNVNDEIISRLLLPLMSANVTGHVPAACLSPRGSAGPSATLAQKIWKQHQQMTKMMMTNRFIL